MKRSISQSIMAAADGQHVEWMNEGGIRMALITYRIGALEFTVTLKDFDAVYRNEHIKPLVHPDEMGPEHGHHREAVTVDQWEDLQRVLLDGPVAAEALKPYVSTSMLAWTLAELIDEEGRPAFATLLQAEVPEPRNHAVPA